MSISAVDIRKATSDDADMLVILNKKYNDTDHINTDVSMVAKSLANSVNEVVFVAVNDKQIIGFASVQIYRSFCYKRPTFELTELFILEEMRRLKAGTLLINKVLEYAAQEEALEINLRVNGKNESAVKFYESTKLHRANHFVFRVKYY